MRTKRQSAGRARPAALLVLLLVAAVAAWAQSARPLPTQADELCRACVRAHMEFLASDALRGRGSATHDELVAARYIAAQLQMYGLAPAAKSIAPEARGNGHAASAASYLQVVELEERKLAGPPLLTITAPGAQKPALAWTHGKEVIAVAMGQVEVSGPLQTVDLSTEQGRQVAPERGAVVLLKPATGKGAPNAGMQAFGILQQGAVAVLLPETENMRKNWKNAAANPPQLPSSLKGNGESLASGFTFVGLSKEVVPLLEQMPAGSVVRLEGKLSPAEPAQTRNVVAVLHGCDQGREPILLSAHLDHVGVGPAVKGDTIYNGADDDATGTTAVLELARIFAQRPQPRRTLIFALFGSEEKGGFGSLYFREHPPAPLESIVANLQFEMLGRPDPKIPPQHMWVTGYERSNLGPTLAQQGAKVVADPHREQNFFQRSDNYVLARKGVVAHTVSSFGLHKDYHQPSDEIEKIDFEHMNEAIQSLVEPIWWLANSDFRPEWVEGKRP